MKVDYFQLKNSLTNFEKEVLSAVKKVPKGRVAIYKEIAKTIGRPKAVRAVGNTLNKNPEAPKIPCHRVVKSNGSIGGYKGGVKEKIKLLYDEGVEVRNNKVVNFERISWRIY